MSSEIVAQVSAEAQETDNRRWFGLAVIVAAQFMVVLDIAIVNVALPSIKTDLHFSQESLQWVITAYSIFFGGVLLLGGRLADVLGRRRCGYRRSEGAGLRDDPRHGARLAHRGDARLARGFGRAGRRVRRDRVSLEGAAAANADLSPADAHGVEHHRPADGRCGLLTVLPAHPLHAAGAALLGAEDRRRLHRLDARDHQLLGRLADAGDANRNPPRADDGAPALGGRARALREAAGARELLQRSLPGVPDQRRRPRAAVRADLDLRPDRRAPG